MLCQKESNATTKRKSIGSSKNKKGSKSEIKKKMPSGKGKGKQLTVTESESLMALQVLCLAPPPALLNPLRIVLMMRMSRILKKMIGFKLILTLTGTTAKHSQSSSGMRC